MRTLLTLFAVLIFSTSLYASELSCSSEKLVRSLTKLGENASSLTVLHTEKVPDLNLCEYVVRAEGTSSVLYANDQYLVPANVIDLETGSSRTQEALSEYQRLVSGTFQQFKAVSGKTIGTSKKEIVIVSDPECPYCEKLLQNLSGLESEFTFHYVFFPLQTHAVGQLATYELQCTDDGKKRLESMTTIDDLAKMKDGVEARLLSQAQQPSSPLCDTIVKNTQEIFEIFRRNQINSPSVPFLVFPDESIINGAVSRDAFLKHAKRHLK